MKARELQKKIKLEFMLCTNVLFMPSPTVSVYNLFFFTKLTQI